MAFLPTLYKLWKNSIERTRNRARVANKSGLPIAYSYIMDKHFKSFEYKFVKVGRGKETADKFNIKLCVKHFSKYPLRLSFCFGTREHAVS